MPSQERENFSQGIGARGKALRDAWFGKLDEYGKSFPDLAENLAQNERPKADSTF